jgi:ribose 1,5-bisphosphokinase PhnN
MKFTPRVVVVVGSPGSGKDILIRAVKDLGVGHARIVPKHTSRQQRPDDGNEMICPESHDFALDQCDIVYVNYDDRYGIISAHIWQGLKEGVFQVIVVSNVAAINQLKAVFSGFLLLVYVHSEMTSEQYLQSEATSEHDEYAMRRSQQLWETFEMYMNNFLSFDHVLIHGGTPEDLYDQIFRLFRAYERGLI